MVDQLHKFPSTPHLTSLGKEAVRTDKVFTPSEINSFLRSPIIIEEKIDGANLGISFNQSGQLHFQNRGNWLKGKFGGQWECLRGWAIRHETKIQKLLPEDHILFGEWCYAKHSIQYDRLPDWYVIFDIYNVKMAKFWSAARRNEFAAAANLATVPFIAHGVFNLSELTALLNSPSSFGIEQREGLYLRQEEGGWLIKRAKIVRPEFSQAISEHWSRKNINLNRIRNLT